MYFTCRVLLSKQIETATHYQIILVPKKRNFFLIKEREHSIRVTVIELCTHCRHPSHPHTILIAFLPLTFWLLHFLRSPSLPLWLVFHGQLVCIIRLQEPPLFYQILFRIPILIRVLSLQSRSYAVLSRLFAITPRANFASVTMFSSTHLLPVWLLLVPCKQHKLLLRARDVHL